MDKNYTIYHSHDDMSLLDSVTKYKDYIDKAKECGMNSFGLSNHGNIFGWINKKQECNKNGLKYIHGQEFYITKSLDNKVRDNWHCILIAKNYDGVKELNKLSSIAYHRDGHYYYDARISLQELINTSNNIFITTACLAGILNSKDEEVCQAFLKFASENKDRCFLEIQHHNNEKQSEYNKKLLKLSEEYNLKLIAGTDTHNLNKEHSKLRSILQKSKGINFPDEDQWDLDFKTYDELVSCYKAQNSLSEEVYLEAIENTNIISNTVEDFEFDITYKYPKVYDDSEKIFRQKVYEGLKEKGLENNQEYKDRIEYEIIAIKKNNAFDYLLLQEKIISWCNRNGIYQGYSRGSVSGCLCAYLLNIISIDAIKFGLNFERFMNVERINLSDIDIDYPPEDREKVKEYIFNELGLDCCDIITFNTIAKRGSIRDAGRALEIPLSEINTISKEIDTVNENKYKIKYAELFNISESLENVITSIGVHPSGLVVTTENVDEEFGTFTLLTDVRKISQIDMKDIDKLNFVKLDILGLDNIRLINETCLLSNIEKLTPNNIDFEDDNVWNDILDSNIGIFQFESDFAHLIYKKLFDKSTLKRIEEQTGKVDRLALLSMCNGAIRPAGESYRDSICKGEFKDNRHEKINEMLKSTMGRLVYQEQIMEFLNKFCGYSMGKADVVRKGLAKKIGTDQYIPEIEESFIKTMKEKYNTPEEESEKIVKPFLQVISDASGYGFSLNHSLPYSMISYCCAYLRYYHKIEFITTMLNINKDNMDKTVEIINYAKNNEIQIKAPKFRYSRSFYFYDNKTNIIYKDLASIKYINQECGEDLFKIKDIHFDSFVDFLIYSTENLKINSKQMDILIKINFFEEFGNNKKLLDVYNEFYKGKSKYSIKIKEGSKEKRIKDLREIEKNTKNSSMGILDQIAFEYENLGYVQTTYDQIDKRFTFVLDINEDYSPRANLYCLKTGRTKDIKIQKLIKKKNQFNKFDILYCKKFTKREAVKFIDNKYVKIENEFQFWLEDYDVISPEQFDKTILNI